MTQSNGPEPARNALIYGKTENNTPDTPTATTANQQHNQHILTYMPKLLTVEGGGKWSDELRDACDAGEYTAGLIIALAACEDQGLKPDRQILRATLASPWCEEGCDADVIARHMLDAAAYPP